MPLITEPQCTALLPPAARQSMARTPSLALLEGRGAGAERGAERGAAEAERVLADVMASVLPHLQAVQDAVSRTLALYAAEAGLVELREVRSIPATYRMTNKPPPTKPSPYVAKLLQCVLAHACPRARVPHRRACALSGRCSGGRRLRAACWRAGSCAGSPCCRCGW